MFYNHISFAERVARKYSSDSRHMVAALQIRGGHVINFGVNSVRYSRDCSYFDCSLHAEVDLVRKSGFDLRGDKICIYRFNRAQGEGDARTSRPCPLCVNLLVQADAGRLIFKVNDSVECCKPTDLPMVAVDPIALTKKYIPHFRYGRTRKLDLTNCLV